MIVVFRTDASLDIGTGHVMRCLTLAEALREKGALCRFVCRAHPGNLLNEIRQRGFEATVLSGQNVLAQHSQTSDGVGVQDLTHAAWLGADWSTDVAQTKVAIGPTTVDWLIVDHYAIDARWEQQLRSGCCRLMVIDDLADRPHDCDLLLDQNLGRAASDYTDLVPRSCIVLNGPKYALLRPEFSALRDYSLTRRVTPNLKHILICMGGVDKDNATCKVLDALRGSTLQTDCRITVVMGTHAPWLNQVRNLSRSLPCKTEVLVNVYDMAKLMADSDLAIGAAGSTSWERCSLGLPSIIVVLAPNQQLIAQGLEAVGAVKTAHIGTLNGDVHKTVTEFAATPSLLSHMSVAAAGVTDGSGTGNVIRNLLEQKAA